MTDRHPSSDPDRPLPPPSTATPPPPPPDAAAPVAAWVGFASIAATIAFFVCGLAFDGWRWAWLFFLVPGLLAAFASARNASRRR